MTENTPKISVQEAWDIVRDDLYQKFDHDEENIFEAFGLPIPTTSLKSQTIDKMLEILENVNCRTEKTQGVLAISDSLAEFILNLEIIEKLKQELTKENIMQKMKIARMMDILKLK